mmetsp:Transcript_41490/g.65809  ORF Transcript_41490/g.65809 Transcript_41490/m.65809 type:complete len:263 (+) Transcript_41490:108-896(+)
MQLPFTSFCSVNSMDAGTVFDNVFPEVPPSTGTAGLNSVALSENVLSKNVMSLSFNATGEDGSPWRDLTSSPGNGSGDGQCAGTGTFAGVSESQLQRLPRGGVMGTSSRTEHLAGLQRESSPELCNNRLIASSYSYIPGSLQTSNDGAKPSLVLRRPVWLGCGRMNCGVSDACADVATSLEVVRSDNDATGNFAWAPGVHGLMAPAPSCCNAIIVAASSAVPQVGGQAKGKPCCAHMSPVKASSQARKLLPRRLDCAPLDRC